MTLTIASGTTLIHQDLSLSLSLSPPPFHTHTRARARTHTHHTHNQSTASHNGSSLVHKRSCHINTGYQSERVTDKQRYQIPFCFSPHYPRQFCLTGRCRAVCGLIQLQVIGITSSPPNNVTEQSLFEPSEFLTENVINFTR